MCLSNFIQIVHMYEKLLIDYINVDVSPQISSSVPVHVLFENSEIFMNIHNKVQ